MVLDPASCRAPCTIDQWKDKQSNVAPENVIRTVLGQPARPLVNDGTGYTAGPDPTSTSNMPNDSAGSGITKNDHELETQSWNTLGD
jgi:hypothetical protein